MRTRKNTPAAPAAAPSPLMAGSPEAASQQPEARPGAVDGLQVGKALASSAAPEIQAPQDGEAPAEGQPDGVSDQGVEQDQPASDLAGDVTPAVPPAAVPDEAVAGDPFGSLLDGYLATGAIVVKGPAKGRRRAGRAFGPEPTVIQLVDLSEEEWEAIYADPELLVTEL